MNKASKSFYSGSHIPIKYRHKEATQQGNKNSSRYSKATQKPVTTSRYNNCVLLLSPFRLRTFSQQVTTLWRHFITQTSFFLSPLSESHAGGQLFLMDLIIMYINYLSG